MIVSWVLREPPKGDNPDGHAAEMRKRALLLWMELYDKKTQIIIPTVVVSECLVPIPPLEHGGFIAKLQKMCFLAPFDLAACSLAAQLWQQHRGLPKDQRIERSVLKSDVMIVAAAKIAGASVFYSHDEKCRLLARSAGMTAKDLPTHSEDMFKNLLLKQNRDIELKESGDPVLEEDPED
jgi:hypothetical protein